LETTACLFVGERCWNDRSHGHRQLEALFFLAATEICPGGSLFIQRNKGDEDAIAMSHILISYIQQKKQNHANQAKQKTIFQGLMQQESMEVRRRAGAREKICARLMENSNRLVRSKGGSRWWL